MSKDLKYKELKEIADQLLVLKEKNPAKYYEYKGRINALFENAQERERNIS